MAIPLKTARTLKGITQAQLAEASGVDGSTISNIERGENTNPTWDTVCRIAAALGVQPQDIFPCPPDVQLPEGGR
jgi:transcriptional regulator with XRE-family HTH domain